jgi:hypothetical protein
MSVVSKFLIGAAAIFVAIQFVRPPINHPPVTAELQVPAPVAQILRNSCYNCHSNETRLSWFDQVAPARWLVAYDVKTARSHVNFSELGKLPPAAQRATLYEAVNQIRLGAMPLPRYRHAHPHSVITPQQLDVLEQYLQPFAPLSPVPVQTAEIQKAETEAQYHQWAASSHAERTVQSSPQPAPNGLTFFPDYKNWKTISSTDRGDNHTLRLILANDIAVKAIADKKIQPWPDGAVFAKVAWDAKPDQQGVLPAGKFEQVEFMVKDKKKYASTAGWGFGRWKGIDLKPYGKNAGFAGECVGCHTPLRDNDYVYTVPIVRNGE